MADATCTSSARLNGVSNLAEALARGMLFELGTVTFSTYATGGVAMGSIGIKDPSHVFIMGGKYKGSWDATNQLMKLYKTGSSLSTALIEVGAVDPSMSDVPYLALKFPA